MLLQLKLKENTSGCACIWWRIQERKSPWIQSLYVVVSVSSTSWQHQEVERGCLYVLLYEFRFFQDSGFRFTLRIVRSNPPQVFTGLVSWVIISCVIYFPLLCMNNLVNYLGLIVVLRGLKTNNIHTYRRSPSTLFNRHSRLITFLNFHKFQSKIRGCMHQIHCYLQSFTHSPLVPIVP